MVRKVLLSFLGSSNYKNCVYHLGESEDKTVVRFVQEALGILVCQEWTENDCIFIFLTEEAQRNNWLGECYVDKIGLKQKLSDLKLSCQIIPITGFKEGIGEDQIWENFKLIYDCLEECDQVWLDITNAFRSIPIFATVLIQYAKFLKNISTQAVLYGAFEALGVPAYQVDTIFPNEQERRVPILNLKNLIELQDWTIAANDFLQHGNSNLFVTLAQSKSSALSEYMDILAHSFSTVRGKEIVKGTIFKDIRTAIQQIKPDESTQPLNILLKKIEAEVAIFEDDEIKNGIRAVEWCLKHHLIQQGITLLQETIISILCKEMNISPDKFNERTKISQAFNCINRVEKSWQKNIDKDKVKQIHQNFLFKQLEPAYNGLKDSRNDINHGGYAAKAQNYQHFKEILSEKLDDVKKILKIQ